MQYLKAHWWIPSKTSFKEPLFLTSLTDYPRFPKHITVYMAGTGLYFPQLSSALLHIHPHDSASQHDSWDSATVELDTW